MLLNWYQASPLEAGLSIHHLNQSVRVKNQADLRDPGLNHSRPGSTRSRQETSQIFADSEAPAVFHKPSSQHWTTAKTTSLQQQQKAGNCHFFPKPERLIVPFVGTVVK